MSLCRTVLLAVLLLALAGCVTPQKKSYTLGELQKVIDSRLSREEREQCAIPFAISPEIKRAAHEAVRNLPDDYSRAVALVNQIVSATKLNVIYDRAVNRTADEVYQGKGANCLSFTNLFIAMAREVGMNSVFVDVTEVEDVSEEGELIVHSGHICAGIYPSNSFALIDFAPNPERHYARYRIIDDIEAMANYYNNLGYEMAFYKQGNEDRGYERDADLRCYRLAVRIMPTFSKAYNNLGVAYVKRGQFREAEQAYKKAVVLEPELGEAHGNLGNLYFAKREYARAERQYDKAIRFSQAVHYYYSQLGAISLARGQLDEAISNYRKALRRNKKYAPAWVGLGTAQYRMGDLVEAQRSYEAALEADSKNLEAAAALRQLQSQMSPAAPDEP
jgi:Flp pilus assembly protein TadD